MTDPNNPNQPGDAHEDDDRLDENLDGAEHGDGEGNDDLLDDDGDEDDGKGGKQDEVLDDPNQTKVLPPAAVADLDATPLTKLSDTAKSGELSALDADGQPKDKPTTESAEAAGDGPSIPTSGPSTGAAFSAEPDTGNSAVDQLVKEAQRLFGEAVARMGEMKNRAKSSKELLELYISLVEQMVFVVNLLMAALEQRGDVDLKTLTQVLMGLFTDIKDGLNALSSELADKDLLERAQRVHASATKVVERARGRSPS